MSQIPDGLLAIFDCKEHFGQNYIVSHPVIVIMAIMMIMIWACRLVALIVSDASGNYRLECVCMEKIEIRQQTDRDR